MLLDPPIPPDANDWSPDGRFILYAINGLWALPLDGNHKPFAVVQSSFAENNSRFPPDGRWIAFQSTETGRNEIYCPGISRSEWQVADFDQWRNQSAMAARRAGLFYMGPNNRLMAMPIKLRTNGQAVEAGTPVTLFTVRPGSQYEPAPDGQRFLLNTLTEGAAPITVILNWAGRPK